MASSSLISPALTVSQHRVQLIELQLLQVEITEEIRGKGAQLLGRFDQPVQHRVGIDLEDPRRGADTQTLGQAGQDPHDQLHRGLFAVEDRAMMSRENSPGTRYSGTDARGRHWDDHWPADCPAPASRDSHNRCGDKSASRCPRYGGVGS